jgi:hypothetical protein
MALTPVANAQITPLAAHAKTAATFRVGYSAWEGWLLVFCLSGNNRVQGHGPPFKHFLFLLLYLFQSSPLHSMNFASAFCDSSMAARDRRNEGMKTGQS